MTPDEEVEALTAWATRSDAVDRGQLLLALANVVAAEDLRRRPRAQALVEALMPPLSAEATPVVRQELAVRLADAPWAPDGVLCLLAAAPLAEARPLLARGPALPDALLARLAAEGSPERLSVLARRSALAPAVVDALLDRAEPDSLAALAGNAAVTLSTAQTARLVALSRRIAALRAPLARRPELTPELAGEMMGWSGEGCRRALASRFELGPAPAPPAPDTEAQGRFLSKLERAGGLTPGYALRVLREGRLSLFEQALAALGGLSPDAVRRALDAPGPEPLAEACAAAGLDPCVHPVIAAHVRALNGGRPGRGAGQQMGAA